MSNLFAMVTFGNPSFTKLAFKSIQDTVKNNLYSLFAVVGKPGDQETIDWLKYEGIPHIIHNENMGFPISLNDIYDYTWKQNNFDNLIIMGNDVVLYPYAGDSLIDLAENSDYSVISALQYDVKDLTREFPETKNNFIGDDYIINDFSQEPWNKFTEYSREKSIAGMQLYDIQNLCLYKKQYFDEVGYTDVNFFPAYFVDNDLARRIVLSKIKCCTLTNARFFHFWSRTIKQGGGGSTHRYFENNKRYYKTKWGGEFGHETKIPSIKIDTRQNELSAISLWKDLHG